MPSKVTPDDVKYLLTLRSQFLDNVATSYTMYTVGGAVDPLVYSENIGHAISLIDHGMEREAIAPLKRIEAHFNREAADRRKMQKNPLSRILAGEGLEENAASWERAAQRIRDIQAKLG